MTGGGGSTTVQPAPPTAEERALTRKQIELAEFQLEELRRQREFQEQHFEELGPFIEEQREFVQRQQERADRLAPVQDELLQLELDRIRRGPAATPEQLELIGDITEQGLAAGESDISRFQQEATERLRNELAPALGLRPTDAPIVDRAGRIAEESVRQQGQLASNLREAQSTAALNFPLAANQLQSAQTQFQQNLAQSVQDFQAQLREQAFLNRLRLGESRGSLGLGLAGNPAATLQGAQSILAQQRPVTQTTSGGGIGLGQVMSGLGGVGGFLQGASAVGLFSSRDFKDVHGNVDPEKALAVLKRLPVAYWTYKGEDRTHIGTFAEDFRDELGIGDGVTINVIDAIGLLMAAVQGLANEVKHG